MWAERRVGAELALGFPRPGPELGSTDRPQPGATAGLGDRPTGLRRPICPHPHCRRPREAGFLPGHSVPSQAAQALILSLSPHPQAVGG